MHAHFFVPAGGNGKSIQKHIASRHRRNLKPTERNIKVKDSTKLRSPAQGLIMLVLPNAYYTKTLGAV